MKYDKIFLIGCNKAGTKSFNKLFGQLDLKSQHDRKNWDLKDYQCFTDGFHYNKKFIEYHKMFENSLFILNTRPLNNWLKSKSKHGYLYAPRGIWPPNYTQYIEWIQQRDTHFNEVINYFSDKNHKLLICNIEKEGWENFIASNISKDKSKTYSVHENRIQESKIDPSIRSLIDEELNKAYLDLKYTDEDKIKLLPANNNISLYKQYLI